jgi:uncharacterized membrane protein
MRRTKSKWTDERIDLAISIILRIGVGVAALVVLTGGIYYLSRHGAEFPHYRTFLGQPAELRSLPGIVGFALSSHSRGIIELGLLLLIATPIARVAFCVVAFALQRDRAYVVVTLIVLTVLVYNLIGGYR